MEIEDSYIEIDVTEKKDEILKLLKDYTIEIHTNADEKYKYLEESGISISVMSGNKELLWIELDEEIALGIGGWHTHYSPYPADYNEFLSSLKEFIDNRRCGVCIMCKDKWMGGFDASEDELAEEQLVEQVNRFLSAREFQERMRENGYSIVCSFLNPDKDRVYTIKAHNN